MTMDTAAYTEAEKIDQQFLEIMEEEFAEKKCQSEHSYPGNQACSHKAVALMEASCVPERPGIPVCLNHVMSVQRRMSSKHTCSRCARPCGECWMVTPL